MDFKINNTSISPSSTKKQHSSNKKLCICKVLHPVLYTIRFTGCFPVVWYHHKGQCVYKHSYKWIAYSFVMVGLYAAQLLLSTDCFKKIGKNKSLPLLLNDITDTIYSSYVILLTVLNMMRYPRFIKALNHLLTIIKDGILCQSSMRCILYIQYGFIILCAFILILQYSILVWLHYSDSYQTNFDYNIFINRFIQNIPFLFYALVFCCISLFIGILGCFEKLTISSLKFTPVHPMKEIKETNNTRDFFGILTYEVCKEDHPVDGKLLKLSQPELIEFLRCMHEDVSVLIYEINDCLNPQFLFHTVVELTVLIIYWYSVIIYTAFKFAAPLASTIHILNCIFVVLHTLGLFFLLKNAQQLKNMIQGLNNFLLEYSTRISSAEEHQQIRIFIEKLKQHRPLTASGVFTIDLGIAGPICANILTYVLVALQFDIPKE